jgi:hypothetical protein
LSNYSTLPYQGFCLPVIGESSLVIGLITLNLKVR